MNSFFKFLLITLFSVNAFAEVVCIRNAKEYLDQKEKIPKLFQKLPIKLGGESPGRFYDVFAAIAITIQGNSIMLISDSWQGPKGHYNNPAAEVKSVCFDSTTNEMTISFMTEAKDFVGFYSDTEVRLPDITLKKINLTQERAIIEKIYKKVPRETMPIIETPASQKEVN